VLGAELFIGIDQCLDRYIRVHVCYVKRDEFQVWIHLEFFRPAMRCVVFLTLKVYGRGVYVCSTVISILAIL
jgi:hypothetical protein